MCYSKDLSLKKKLATFMLATVFAAVPIVASACTSGKAHAEENIQKHELNNMPKFYSGIVMPEFVVSLDNTFSIYSSDALMYNTIYGEWSESFRNYNCYAFALGRTDNRFNIGDFSNHILNTGYDINGDFVLYNTIQELADYTVQDLHSLGYQCVYSSKNSFFQPYETQTLICVRKSKEDFHFMKYVNGSWLHKPGNTWILKYNSVPNSDEDWIVEAASMKFGQIIYQSNAGYPYTGDIYFIKYASSHNYNSYQYANNDQHNIICNNCCSTLRSESHTFVPYRGAKLGKICTGCGYILYKDGLGQIIMKEDDEKI